VPVRLGINPIGWTNDDMPELGDDTPLEVCLEEARAAGYDGIELGRKFPRTAAELRPLLARHGLSLVSGWYGARLQTRSAREEIEAMQPEIELLEAMGCSVMVFAEVGRSVHALREVPGSRRPTLGPDAWARFGERLTHVAEYLRGQGLRLAYHHHIGTVVETEDEIERLMEVAGEPVGLLLDTGHLTYAGGNLLRIARRHARRLAHVHCKDVRPGALAEVHRSDLSFLEAVLAGVFTVPGDGVIDWGALLPILKSVGYSGWLAVVEAEQDPAVADPATYGRLGFTNLSRAAAAAGL
jgi:inosose dehydratase